MLERFFRLFLKDSKIEARAKLESVSDTAAVCVYTVHSMQPFFICSMHHRNTKIRQPMAMLYNKNRQQSTAFFYLGCQ